MEEVTQEKLDEMNKFLETECPEMFKGHFSVSLKVQNYSEAQEFMDKVRSQILR